MNTTEKNKIIAEFMGIGFTKDNKANHPRIKAPYPPIECFKYHSDWNWLMEVVEKIETTSLCGEFIIGYDDREEFKGWTSYVGLGTLPSITIKDFENRFNTKIEAVYNACVEFIKWYSEQKN